MFTNRIRTTERLTKEYSEKFISELVNGKVPFDFKIGDAAAAELFGAPTGADKSWTRYAQWKGVQMTAAYRMLGGAVEIGVELKNVGAENSPQIHDIDFCSMELPDASPYQFAWDQRRVLYSVGSPSTIYDFAPREEDLARPESLVLEEKSARCSGNYMPYFNCSSQDTEGVIAAIGWSGHWKARFENGSGCMKIRLSYDADFHLQPQETVKLPTVLLMPWKREKDGNRDLPDTFILFRRLMRDYILPENIKNGYITARAWGAATVEEHEEKLENIKRFRIPCDAYGIDAGWFELDGNGEAGPWYETMGDWHEAKAVHPFGLEWLSRKAKEAGAKGFWLWLEFERSVNCSAAYKAHPEYYLSLPSAEWEGKFSFINMGDAHAREYIKNILYPLIRRIRLTMFRVDFNIDPRAHFEYADAENRDGITELKYYNGLYLFFADMMKEFPELILDNCASGGRRLDYRMCSYGVPVNCRSDYFTIDGDHADGQQAQNIGISRWLPIHGDAAYSFSRSKAVPKDTYADRSAYSGNYSLTAFSGKLSEQEGRRYLKLVEDAYTAREFMALDFYPLTGYSLSPLDWCAYEMCAEDGSRALVMAFRREHNPTPKQIYALYGLSENRMYQIRDFDSDRRVQLSGKELMAGFEIEIPKARDSRIFILEGLKEPSDNK